MEHHEAGQHADVLQRLRQSTSAHHRAVESDLGLAAPFTREHYLRVLEGFDAFLQSWEALILRSVPLRLKRWTQEGLRHADLRHDLKVLGLAPAKPAPLHIPITGRAAAMGSLYVLEGSALGAQVIAPRLASEHGLDASNGGRYFAADPRRAAARWRDFRFILQQEVDSPAASRQACRAAIATFEALRGVFRPLVQTDEARAG